MTKISTIKDINIKSVDHIYNKFKIFKDDFYGNTSTLFKYKKGTLLKLFECPISDYMYETLSFLSTLKTKTTAKITNFFKIDGERYGYIVEERPGKNLLQLPANVNVRSFISSMKPVEKDVKLISSNKIATDDLKPANMLYDKTTNISSIIDQDCYFEFKDASKELVTFNNLQILYLSILESIICPVNGAIDDDLYKSLVETILCEFTFDTTIDNYYDYLLNIIEDYYDKEIVTVGDVRKSLRKK